MNAINKYVLIVEDDAQIRSFITYLVKNEGFSYITAENAQDALSILVSKPIDLMLLDLGLPDYDGMELIKKVREWSQMPIIVVSARDQETEKAKALDNGADDYLTKPFSSIELLARIRVALRHYYHQAPQSEVTTLSTRGLCMDLEKHLVYLDQKELHVTPMEYTLLKLLMSNAGKVLTTSFIIKNIWGVGYGNDTQALRTLMAGLRRKIEKNPAKPEYIMTEMGVGYRLME